MGTMGSVSILFGAVFVIALLLAGAVSARNLSRAIPGVLALYRVHRLGSTTGHSATGLVISSREVITTSGEDYTRTMVETIRFAPDSGDRVEGSPLLSDVGMEDRTGEEVPIVYDPEDPACFLAPQDGSRVDLIEPARQLITPVVAGIGGLLAFAIVLPMALRVLPL